MSFLVHLLGQFKGWVGDDVAPESLTLRQIAIRATLIYVIGIVLIRLGKSRLIGRSSPLDVLVGFMLGAILGGAVIGRTSTVNAITATTVLVVMHWLCTAVAARWHRFGELVKGRVKVIFENGVLNEENMRSSHLSEHDLIEAVRFRANVDSLNDVEAAYKERNGEISVVKKKPG